MSISLGVVMDPIESITPYKDTTFAMLLAAQDRGWPIYSIDQSDLFLRQGRVYCTRRQLRVSDTSEHWFEVVSTEDVALAEHGIVLMRKDPPVDMDFTYTTHLLELAQAEGVYVGNRPDSIRNVNEKLSTAWFSDLTPPMVVTASSKRLKAFVEEHNDVIIKPLNGMGGAGIYRLRPADPNINIILEQATAGDSTQIMAQRYVPEIVDGDKRVLVVNGEAVPYVLARIPTQGETRGNLAAGGRGVVKAISEDERRIVDAVAPFLLERGLMFVGLDVIGSYLTEINVTSPTCAREIDSYVKALVDDPDTMTGTHWPGIANMYLDALQSALTTQSAG